MLIRSHQIAGGRGQDPRAGLQGSEGDRWEEAKQLFPEEPACQTENFGQRAPGKHRMAFVYNILIMTCYDIIKRIHCTAKIKLYPRIFIKRE